MAQQPDYAYLAELARSPAGQELLSALQCSGGDALPSAAALVEKGDYAGAKALLSDLLASPEVQRLLEQLGGQG